RPRQIEPRGPRVAVMDGWIDRDRGVGDLQVLDDAERPEGLVAPRRLHEEPGDLVVGGLLVAGFVAIARGGDGAARGRGELREGALRELGVLRDRGPEVRARDLRDLATAR